MWIIPARAGFTRRPSRTRAARRDHPRSRGVYPSSCSHSLLACGSSPLARGLRGSTRETEPEERIIPARAGFTDRPQRRPWPRPRIIPARAGFTPTTRAPWICARGSSPLARGLPRQRLPPHSHRGIIPARAGFTSRCRPTTVSATDHPRSRGVYDGPRLPDDGPRGSSPLARGLHVVLIRGPQTARIIPARAGFTAAHCVCAVRARDHPRSRGVYGRPGRRARRVRGSSPLARGLLRAVRVLPEPKRIIPARAGFTVERRGQHLHQRDHPRSRGVYFTSEILFQEITGSSPLARGLRHERHRLPRGHGIIPARAGFTWPRRRCRAW